MGWNTWNKYNCQISEDIIKSNADEIVNLGLDKLGYVYVNIDDCWQIKDRDAQNHVQYDKTKFPNGMKAIGDYLHSKNLKFGIYSSAGTMTCQQRAGSLDFETIDAADYYAWGVDYLKYDNCYNQGRKAVERYTKMRDALLAQPKQIYYSICNWGEEDTWKWAKDIGNSWRTTGDISNSWSSMRVNYLQSSQHPEIAGPGGWNDPDMLEIGNGGMSLVEEKSHFALWAFVKSPLILGCDLTKLSTDQIAIISNQNIIKLNQDSLGQQAKCVQGCNGNIEVYQAYHNDLGGYYGLLVVNWSDWFSQSIEIDFLVAGVTNKANDTCKLVDLWTGQVIGTFTSKYYASGIAIHDHLALKVTCSTTASKVQNRYQVKYT
ncbi:melibiase family protein [Stylonychia lemnae]|uniref:Alpha-galactosidase n=1 Tax=Stylonychia lemnae TaxID=5949 RepID=A0A078AGL2_STYLE|nr:melibiase family protein [Stylonychia lemnae]|eukprot:CDW79993.1 melibiase family protein [Stylonychia lemnae]